MWKESLACAGHPSCLWTILVVCAYVYGPVFFPVKFVAGSGENFLSADPQERLVCVCLDKGLCVCVCQKDKKTKTPAVQIHFRLMQEATSFKLKS